MEIPDPIPDARPLTERERELLAFLLKHGEPEAAAFVDQLPEVTVVSHCSCGCPTLDLAVGGRRGIGPSTILADVLAVSPEGVRCGIILHGREGLISELEGYLLDDKRSFTFPDVDKITFLPVA
jgi:hypothetical protein